MSNPSSSTRDVLMRFTMAKIRPDIRPVIKALEKLEWTFTNPYLINSASDTMYTLQYKESELLELIEKIPARLRFVLLTRPLNYYDDGTTTLDPYNQGPDLLRARTLTRITAVYFEAMKKGMAGIIMSNEEKDLIEREIRAHWYQRTHLSRAS